MRSVLLCRNSLLSILVAFFLLSLPGFAGARVFQVNDTDTLTSALLRCHPGDEIRLDPATYQTVEITTAPLSLTGERGVIIEGKPGHQGDPNDNARPAVIISRKKGVSLQSLEMIGGTDWYLYPSFPPKYVHAMEITSSTVSLIDCRFPDRGIQSRIIARDSELFMESCASTNTSCGVDAINSRLELIDCRFAGCQGKSGYIDFMGYTHKGTEGGTGVSLQGGTAVLVDCDFKGGEGGDGINSSPSTFYNGSGGYGGGSGLIFQGPGRGIMIRCRSNGGAGGKGGSTGQFFWNLGGGGGGHGLFLDGASVTCDSCEMKGGEGGPPGDVYSNQAPPGDPGSPVYNQGKYFPRLPAKEEQIGILLERDPNPFGDPLWPDLNFDNRNDVSDFLFRMEYLEKYL